MKELIENVYSWLETAGHTFGDSSKVVMSLDLCEEELTELTEANVNNDREEIKDAQIDTFWVVLNNAFFNGITVDELLEKLEKVNNSNWSKFCNTESEAQHTVELYKTGKHPDKMGEEIDTYFTYRNEKYVILRKKDSKVLKSWMYRPVNNENN